MKKFEFRAMNTDIQLGADGPEEAVETGFSQAKSFIEACEKRFTRFSEESELSALNRSAGKWFEVSTDMFDVVSQAATLHRQTLGLFDPAILAALENAGYDRSYDEIRKFGAFFAPVAIKPSLHRFSDVRLDSVNRRIWLPPDLRIDLGGIAKGWIAEQAAILLSSWSSACGVDAGGDAFFIGLPADEPFWRVALEDPLDPQNVVANLKVQPGAVVTSAVTRRRWQQGGKMRHHLIDPRSQQPAETDWLSVTVLAPHATQAEVYAKSLLILGSRQALQLAEQASPKIEFIAVDGQKKLWGSKHSMEVLDV